MKRSINLKRGFTISELIIVIAIMLVLGVVVIGAVTRYMDEAEKEYNVKLKDQVLITGKNYFAENKSELPSATYDTISYSKYKTITLAELRSKKYVNKIYQDYDGRDCSDSYIHVERPSDSNNYIYTVCMICKGEDGSIENHNSDPIACNISNWEDRVHPTCEFDSFHQQIPAYGKNYNPYGITLKNISDDYSNVNDKKGKIAYLAIINSKDEVAVKFKATTLTADRIATLLKQHSTGVYNKYLWYTFLPKDSYKVVLYDTGGLSSNVCAEFDIDREKSKYQIIYHSNDGTYRTITRDYYFFETGTIAGRNTFDKYGYYIGNWKDYENNKYYSPSSSIKRNYDYTKTYEEQLKMNFDAQWYPKERRVTIRVSPSAAGSATSYVYVEYGTPKSVSIYASSDYEYDGVYCTGGLEAYGSRSSIRIYNNTDLETDATCTVYFTEIPEEEEDDGGGSTTPTPTPTPTPSPGGSGCSPGREVYYAGKYWTVIRKESGGCGLALKGVVLDSKSGTYSNAANYLSNTWMQTTSLKSETSNLVKQSGYYVTSNSNSSLGYISDNYFVSSTMFYNKETRKKYTTKNVEYLSGAYVDKDKSKSIKNALEYVPLATIKGSTPLAYAGLLSSSTYGAADGVATFKGGALQESTSARYGEGGRKNIVSEAEPTRIIVDFQRWIYDPDTAKWTRVSDPEDEQLTVTCYQKFVTCSSSNIEHGKTAAIFESDKTLGKDNKFLIDGVSKNGSAGWTGYFAGHAFTNCNTGNGCTVTTITYNNKSYTRHKRTYNFNNYNGGKYCTRQTVYTVKDLDVKIKYRPYIIVKKVP